jgi:hypothetical protein
LEKRKLKRLLAGGIELLPGSIPLDILDWLRRLRYAKLREEYREHNRLHKAIGSPLVVMQGPFKGMHYLNRAYFGRLLPKVLGTYEMELWPVIETICAIQSDCIVDLGAAEGYYAVGLARRNPQAKVTAFEVYRPVWPMIQRLSRLNGLVTDRIEIRGAATPELLEASLKGARRPVIISDIEGFEDDVLDPGRVRALKLATLLIEVHEDIRQGVTRRIRRRFNATHTLEVFGLRPRTPTDLPTGIRLTGVDLRRATDERREKAEWFFFQPLHE